MKPHPRCKETRPPTLTLGRWSQEPPHSLTHLETRNAAVKVLPPAGLAGGWFKPGRGCRRKKEEERTHDFEHRPKKKNNNTEHRIQLPLRLGASWGGIGPQPRCGPRLSVVQGELTPSTHEAEQYNLSPGLSFMGVSVSAVEAFPV